MFSARISSSSSTFLNSTGLGQEEFAILSSLEDVERVYKGLVLRNNQLGILSFLLQDSEIIQDHGESFLKNLNLFNNKHHVIANMLIKALVKEFTDAHIMAMVEKWQPAESEFFKNLIKEGRKAEKAEFALKCLPYPRNELASFYAILHNANLFDTRLKNCDFVYYFGIDLLWHAACLDSSNSHNISMVAEIIRAIKRNFLQSDIDEFVASLPQRSLSEAWKTYIYNEFKRPQE